MTRPTGQASPGSKARPRSSEHKPQEPASKRAKIASDQASSLTSSQRVDTAASTAAQSGGPTTRRERVGLLFSGGPAPGANSVIASCASSITRSGRDAVALLHGYSNLHEFAKDSQTLQEGLHYRVLNSTELRGLRNSRGVHIGTARANPGRLIKKRADLNDAKKTKPLRNVYDALRSLDIDFLISIGGDDTLKSANFLYEFQKRLPAQEKRIRICHVPKTIDNDYRGIDLTFGYVTAVNFMAQELLNLRSDAMASGSYFIVETMGRKAGWLAYGISIAGEAHMVVGVEDVPRYADASGKLSLDLLSDSIVDLILHREKSGNKNYGTVVLAEGLAESLPDEAISHLPRDEHGHLSLGRIDLGKLVAQHVQARFLKRVGRPKKITGIQLGYESRCAPPQAFDVLLGSQLGFGAFQALVEKGLDGVMVSVSGQFDLHYVDFATLVDPETLVTEVRFVDPASDFHRLAHQLGSQVPQPASEGKSAHGAADEGSIVA